VLRSNGDIRADIERLQCKPMIKNCSEKIVKPGFVVALLVWNAVSKPRLTHFQVPMSR